MATGFRSNIFDPLLVSAQIVAMLCCFYLSLGVWLFVADLAGGIPNSLDQIFDYHQFEAPSEGWMLMIAVVGSGFTTALALWLVVRRAKQCLDFTVTVYLVHLLVCSCYGGLPHSWAWWLSNLLGLAIAAILGECLCMRSEMAAIPIASATSRT